jgi:hypothetical protein
MQTPEISSVQWFELLLGAITFSHAYKTFLNNYRPSLNVRTIAETGKFI